ncbi:unnamed protein product [Notodromas monacha]|uniref:HD/PDEase domain-containing protein n=1 Tax=Notodromas monacha TaxID=399045 RepID=A0A7R9BNJ7_9CRUS|nr:unnamed protein product [Notodromas monacha]CAG0918468.1 unnamed protein product [Notodromas monacha]
MANQDGPVIFDSVHGPVTLSLLSHAIIATEQFQRLKNLKQVGAGYWVFPAASNNRYEHCIGTAHVARKLVRQLAQQTCPEVPKLSSQDLLCIELAGLCHDLGHGPFSHTFERFLDEVGCEVRHEETSVLMLKAAVDGSEDVRKLLQTEGISEQDFTFIQELIAGPTLTKGKKIRTCTPWPFVGRGREKAFLYEIVANPWNGIDVDKWDYLGRDCRATGKINRFSFQTVMGSIKALPLDDGQWRICFDESGLYELMTMFGQRGYMHHTVYNCWKKNSIESMLIEAWVAMDKVFYPASESGPATRLCEAVKDPDKFLNLTDGILDTLMKLPCDNPNVRKCQEILGNIRAGNLYAFVGSFWLKPGTKINLHKDTDGLKKRVLELATEGSDGFDATSAWDWVRVHYFTGTRTEPDEVYLYSNRDLKAKPASEDILTAFLEPIYTYDHVQIFARTECQLSLEVLRKAFETLCEEEGFQVSPQGRTCEWEEIRAP